MMASTFALRLIIITFAKCHSSMRKLIGFADQFAHGGTCCLLPLPKLRLARKVNSRSLDCEGCPRSGQPSSLGMTVFQITNNFSLPIVSYFGLLFHHCVESDMLAQQDFSE